MIRFVDIGTDPQPKSAGTPPKQATTVAIDSQPAPPAVDKPAKRPIASRARKPKA